MIYQPTINPKIENHEVPELREAVGWGGRQQDFPALFERCNFYAGIRDATGKLVAFGYICGMGLEHGYLEDIIVHPDYQGMGLGKILVTKLIDYSKEFGLGIITVTFEVENKRFYEKCGFNVELGGVLYLD